jgi:hypothetical protein
LRILVCGGRDFGDIDREQQHHEPDHPAVRKAEKEYQFVMSELTRLSVQYSTLYNPDDNWLPTDIEIISGMAPGVDTVAIDWAVCNWCKWHEFPADWAKHGKAAGPIRNKQMLVEGKPDLVVAFPGGRGTANMVKQAREANVEVIEVPYK